MSRVPLWERGEGGEGELDAERVPASRPFCEGMLAGVNDDVVGLGPGVA